MLQNLHVENLALIDETDVEFTEGLNILTGETGAGKSLIVGSVNLALGAKADSDLIRTGENSALVELTFESSDPEVNLLLKSMDIPMDDNTVLISRRIMPGRSTIKINGESVNAKQLRAVTELLLDIHGQHEHQSLLNKKKHLEILDIYAGEEAAKLLTELKEKYKALTDARAALNEDAMDEDEKKRTLELLEFEYEEIDKAGLKIGEDEELEAAYKKMSNSKKIGDALTLVSRVLGSDEEGSMGLGLGMAIKEMKGISDLDEKLSEMAGTLSDLESQVHDFHRDVDSYIDSLEVDGATFYETETRLNLLNHLKDKYAPTIEGVMEYADKLREKMDALADYDAHMEELNKRVRELTSECEKLSENISKIRQAKAVKLEETLVGILKELSFPDVRFKVGVERKEDFNELGFDDVEFLISANVGEAIRPLKDVASGGELSRIMLGIKTLLAERDAIDTLIFDEIDTGISGKTAWQVASNLSELAKSHQIICITHLAQIAANADSHYLIEKGNDGVRTKTDIKRLDENGSVNELARLLGAGENSESAINNAKEMLLKARSKKNEQ